VAFEIRPGARLVLRSPLLLLPVRFFAAAGLFLTALVLCAGAPGGCIARPLPEPVRKSCQSPGMSFEILDLFPDIAIRVIPQGMFDLYQTVQQGGADGPIVGRQRSPLLSYRRRDPRASVGSIAEAPRLVCKPA
jgi:hypothetical protein